jgi:hypothetical protein
MGARALKRRIQSSISLLSAVSPSIEKALKQEELVLDSLEQ